MAISSAFNISQTGLYANQKAIDVTSNNIANASNKDYTRQRVQFSTIGNIHSSLSLGLGVKIEHIVRVKNIFLFNRFTESSSNLQNLSIKEQYLKEISTYFPDTTDNGIYKNLKDFFNAWQNLASNPNDSSAKVEVASKSKILADSIKSTRNFIVTIQKDINNEIKTKTNEVNDILKKIASLNKKITSYEADKRNYANDLRDKRDKFEKRLKELIDVKIYKSNPKSFKAGGNANIDYEKNYSIYLAGYPLLDNGTYYPLKITDNQQNVQINIVKEDHSLVDVTKNLTKGEIGALISLRGTKFKNNEPINGIIGKILTKLDSLASTLIKNVNSIYSEAAKQEVSTDKINTPVTILNDLANKPLSTLDNILLHPIKNGKLILNIYDDKGNFSNEINVKVNKNDSLNDVIDHINNTIYNNDNNANYGADLVNGQLKFVKGSYDSNGNFTPSTLKEESSKILVKDDGAMLFSAMGEIEYMPLDKINTTKLPLPLENGSFYVVVYNEKGDELAKRKITVNLNSTDPKYSTIEGIVSQINTPSIDDNNDNNSNNDVDDYYNASFINGHFVLSKKRDEETFVGLDKDETKFGGAIGFNKFFEGKNARNIDIKKELYETPSKIQANKTPTSGDNKVANDMLELQSKEVTFYEYNKTQKATLFEYYRTSTSYLANETKNIEEKKEVAETLFKNISDQYYSISGVNIDEELINLEKFQRGYQANAKVITTINKMLDALFNIS